MDQDFRPGELFRLDILAICLYTRDRKFLFLWREEPQTLVCMLGEIDHPEVGENSNDA